MLSTLRNQHFVVTREGQGCPLPPDPTREHQGSRLQGAHGHAVQTADTSTTRGGGGWAWGWGTARWHPAVWSRMGSWTQQGMGSPGWEGSGGDTH